MKRFIFSTLALLSFASPSLAGNGATLDLSKIEAATYADLEAAKADATAHGDTLAYNCYAGVEAYGATHPFSAPTINVVGVASAFQTARDGVKIAETASSSGIPVEIETACGPLALDVQSDLGKAAKGGFPFFGFKF